ncbi:MAG: hypothetical protein MI920_05215 [Kiloniellales bacterium]|nr:hypothetical protein [Kiloniellales bacterium]
MRSILCLAARLATVLALALAALSCSSAEPEPRPTFRTAPPTKPATTPPVSTAPGYPSLGDVVDEVQARRRLIRQLEELEKDEP